MKISSLFTQILIAILLAACTGAFLGDYVFYLQPIGKIYFNFLVMVTIPFVATGLIYGLGSLPLALAKKLLLPALYVFIFLTAIALAIVFLLSLLLPEVKSSILVVSSENTPFSIFKALVDLLIPSNFISDFSNAYMPTIAVFGLIVGLTVIFIPKKEAFLSSLNTVNNIVLKILTFLGALAPIAIFSHLSEVFGTITLLQFEKISIFLSVIALGGLLMALWVFPYLLSPLIGMRYLALIKKSSEILLLVSLTSLPSLAIPRLIDLLRAYEKKEENKSANLLPEKEKVILTQALPTLSFNFAQVGNLFLILFIFFSSFYFRAPLSFGQKTITYILSVPSSWGGPISAPTELLFFDKFLHISELNINLYFGLQYISRIFASLASAMGMYLFCLLTWHWHHKKISFHPVQLFHRFAIVLFSLGFFFLSAKFLLSWVTPPDNFTEHFNEVAMKDLADLPSDITIKKTLASDLPAQPARSLSDIVNSKVLRVGFNDDIPYCLWNKRNELIGYDIAFAYQLAKDLDCSLELIPFEYDFLIEDLLQHKFDIAMAGTLMTTERIEKLRFSTIYAQEENVLIVPAKNLKQFSNLQQIKDHAGLKIGGDGAYFQMASQYFPNAKIVDIRTPNTLILGEVDAIFWSKVSATAWAYSHPDYQVVSFPDQLGQVFVAYPMAPDSTELTYFLNDWLLLKKQSGFTAQQNAFWIDGAPLPSNTHRWSIIRNVLHWVN